MRLCDAIDVKTRCKLLFGAVVVFLTFFSILRDLEKQEAVGAEALGLPAAEGGRDGGVGGVNAAPPVKRKRISSIERAAVKVTFLQLGCHL